MKYKISGTKTEKADMHWITGITNLPFGFLSTSMTNQQR